MADTVSEAAVAAVVAATPTVAAVVAATPTVAAVVAATPTVTPAKAKQYQLALTGIKLQQAISSGKTIKVVEVN
jgi:hypothetical protein